MADRDQFDAGRFDVDRADSDQTENELTRVRRALREVEPEIDLARLYAESRARAGDAAPGLAPADRVGTERVEILLRDPGSAAWRPRSGARRGQAFAWGAAAAAAAILAVSLAGPPVLRALPGSAPSASTSDPSRLLDLTADDVVTRAVQAMGSDSCRLKSRSTLGTESTSGFDALPPTGAEPPKAVLLDDQPLQALHAVSISALFGLPQLEGTDYLLHEDLGMESVDGQTVVRIRITPSDTLVLDGAVTRFELLVDVATWLPLAGEIRAESDQGSQYVMHNEFTWAGCTEPSPGPTEHDDTPGS
ncbi:hypothetical protein AB1046_04900 [Promicromonospora sp. Populi]|uniref:hypothetical protein n=1 Tax=Promicromonospora sp. Populi TaxID=3239420 RepID=UPI0034E1C1D5